jgi:hypothetical protein
METKITIQIFNETKSWFFWKIKKIDKSSAKQEKERGERPELIEIYKKGNIIENYQ